MTEEMEAQLLREHEELGITEAAWKVWEFYRRVLEADDVDMSTVRGYVFAERADGRWTISPAFVEA